MKIPNLEKLLEDQLKDIFSAENQLLKALPKLAKAATAPGLQEAITAHIEETRLQIDRLNEVAQLLEIKVTGKKCAAMEGLVEEAKEALEVDAPDGILDLAIIAAAQRAEHYEISAYGSARAVAEQLGLTDVVNILQEILDEESATDEKLTAIATEEVFPTLLSDADEGDESEADSEARQVPVPKKGKSSRGGASAAR